MTKQEKKTSFLQKNWVQNLLWFAAMLAIFLVLRPYMQGEVAEGKAPNFVAASLTGKQIDLKNVQQKPVLIHFWATWCPICEVELEGIEEISKDYQVIKIATSSGSREELLNYAKTNNMNPDNIVNDQNGSLMKLYGAKAVPASFILDQKGNIQFIEVGFTTTLGLRLRLWSLDNF